RVLPVDVAVRSVVAVDDPRATAGQCGRLADRDVSAVPEPPQAFAGVRRCLDELLVRTVRVDDVHLRAVERRIEPRECDLSVRSGRTCRCQSRKTSRVTLDGPVSSNSMQTSLRQRDAQIKGDSHALQHLSTGTVVGLSRSDYGAAAYRWRVEI